jgi:hypothetical protein
MRPLYSGCSFSKLSNERRHREEIVAADIEHELRIGDVAVEIGQIVDLWNRELEATVDGVVVRPEALAKTFADVLNAISKDAATAVIKSIYQNVTHDIDLQADSRRCDGLFGRLPG